MQKVRFPRLSEARNFLPFLRAALAAAAGRHTLPEGFAVDLLPIVEQGVFGYELQPDQESCDYLTIGRDDEARPVLRRSVYCADAASVLRLATVDGRVIVQRSLDPSSRIQKRDTTFDDWAVAAEAAWTEFDALFPGVPRRSIEIRDDRHRNLDDALDVAHAHLVAWNPCIEFCGVPDEAQYGFALVRGQGEYGQLALRTPTCWVMRWEAAGNTVSRQWLAISDGGPAHRWASASTDAGHVAQPGALPVAATSRQPR
jgi:hypothetical protein